MEKTARSQKIPSKGAANRKKNLILFTMVLPGVIWILLLRYLPMAGILLAFKNNKIFPSVKHIPTVINNFLKSEWVGLDNFKFLFATSDAAIYIRNTIGYNTLWIILGLVFGVAFAILLSEITRKTVAKTYQTLMFFPYFLSWVVVSYFIFAFLSPDRGLLVNALNGLGLTSPDWYNDYKPWPYILTIANLWKNLGYGTVLYLAAITGIDGSQYEAARIDGASKWQQVRFITLPHLKTMIIILLIMNVGKIFNADFGLFFSVPMGSGTLQPATMVVDTYVYAVRGDLGMSSAASLFQNLVGFVLIMITNTIVRKVDPENSLF